MTQNSSFVLRGRCEISSNRLAARVVPCEFDLESARLNCFLPGAQFDVLGHDRFTDEYQIKDICIQGAEGELRSLRIADPLLQSVQGPSLSVDQTDVSHSLGINPQVNRLSFILNEPTEFNSTGSTYEVMFRCSFETNGAIGVDENLYLKGGKHYFSVIGKNSLADERLCLCVSLLLGVAAYPAVWQSGHKVKIWMNHFVPQKSRPLFFRGYPYVNGDMTREESASIFKAASLYVEGLKEPEYAMFANAVNAFMQTRSISQPLELRLLGAFYFLEWLDGSKRMSPNHLADVLNISRGEADQIKSVRDTLVHNKNLVAPEIERAVAAIRTNAKSRFARFDVHGPIVSFSNYLMTLLTEALLSRIKYNGRVGDYFPV